MIVEQEAYLKHYGILRRSGRYPWGSGGTQSSRNRRFIDEIDRLGKTGMSESTIAEGFGITTTQLRAAKSIANNEQRQARINQAQRLREKGMSNVAIGEQMGLNESSIRSLLAPGAKDKADILLTTANMLKDHVADKSYVDIGSGVENHLGISSTKLSTAVAVLREEGYEVHTVKVVQAGTGKLTTFKVLAKPGTTQKEVWQNRHQIKQITDFSDDGGRSFLGVKTPISISSKRVGVNYAEDGGSQADGVIYVRPGVKDVSIGSSRYAQVRIAVDGTHYIKGMAIYKDDLPAGVDLLFNTNKKNTGDKLDALKELKDDPDNPFGAVIRQIHGPDGKLTSAMNIVGSKEGSGEEGGWETWSKSLSSQFLSKQSPDLAKSQLAMTYERKRADLDEIMALTNPAVKKKLLEGYADDADSSAVHLAAAALPRQATHVILPVTSMKPTEIYAPNYNNGDRVALVRYPHGGTFEIPELTVNNRHAEAKKLLGNAKDAVGIHSSVAERLSGADFDGDTVLVIPNNNQKVTSTPVLDGLRGFDTRTAHPPYEGMRTIDGGVYREATGKVDYEGRKPSDARKQQEMGNVSNLITDMTIKGANTQDLARAIRHSMVVIDAEKHSLDFKGSANVNGISQLKTKYQGDARSGASTIISRASSQTPVLDRKPRLAENGGPIDKETGRKVFEYTGATYVNRKGQTVEKTSRGTKLAETHDAHTLVSEPNGTPIERIYADHSNKLKALANTARKESVAVKPTLQSKSAKTVYQPQVATLDAKLNVALKNRPLERQAQVLADSVVSQKKKDNPGMEAADKKKIEAQALNEARTRTGARKQQIEITQSEWNAIQAGAISNSKLRTILNNTDMDAVRKLATPRKNTVMTTAKTARAKSMLSAGYTQAEVAAALGVPLSTLKSSIS